MSVLDVNYMSKALNQKVTFKVVLPIDATAAMSLTCQTQEKPLKTLYLLHGLTGNCTDWLMYTNVEKLAEAANLAVVMPSGTNSFYIDLPLMDQNYGEFIGRELVEITRRMFPLSRKREDTFIAGLSMGGYGAIRNGLKYCDTFGYAAGLSSALHYFELDLESDRRAAKFGEDSLFGPLETAVMSDKNPRVCYQNAKKAGLVPKLLLSCGTEDGLLPYNRSFRDYLIAQGEDFVYEEKPGDHTWEYWNDGIERIINHWLPL